VAGATGQPLANLTVPPPPTATGGSWSWPISTAEAADHRQAILVLVRAWRPDLLTRTGLGPIVAATVLCAWSHAGRCRSDAAFAMLGGAAPSRLGTASTRPCTPWS
jgi:hypothetical protein